MQQHRESLGEIREIMNSMKTLAYMESRKLERYIEAQQAVVTGIETAAADLLHSYPGMLPPASGKPVRAWLVIGSERGFCGDFNQQLLAQLQEQLAGPVAGIADGDAAGDLILVVGQKLQSLLQDDPRLVVAVEGASMAEDLASLLQQLVPHLRELQGAHPGLELRALYHSGKGDVVVKPVLPPFVGLAQTGVLNNIPPLLNLSPPVVLGGLAEHYLFALMFQMLYASLHAENHQRLIHMEGAVKHLDERAAELLRQGNVLRQEEITEEIEVILLNAANLGGCCPEQERLQRQMP
nr:F0F1 ATP synthase subunit gamma [Pseudomaricurvus sp. HS19]